MSEAKEKVVITIERAATGDASQVKKFRKYVVELEYNGGQEAKRSARCVLAIGKVLESLGGHVDAVASYKEACDLDPDNEEILKRLVRGCHRLGLYKEAREYIKRLMEIRGKR